MAVRCPLSVYDLWAAQNAEMGQDTALGPLVPVLEEIRAPQLPGRALRPHAAARVRFSGQDDRAGLL